MENETLEFPEPTLKHIVNSKDLKWIFVGGKGGVGKTTTSCSLGTQLAKTHKSVLIVSTDPAHNLSDAFKQKFTNKPTLVNGFKNLSCMEIESNPEKDFSKLLFNNSSVSSETSSKASSLLNEITNSLPGIDEALSFSELMQQVQKMDYDIVVFDTAPTGHTLRLIGFPSMLEKSFDTIGSLTDSFGGIINQVMSLMPEGDAARPNITESINKMKANIEQVSVRFTNPKETTFICVCIPEFLSVYETERLVQALQKYKMDVNSIVVNQILFPDKDCICKKCLARRKIQDKYINQIIDLFSDYHIVMIPELCEEVRGPETIERFSTNLIEEYNPEEHGEMVSVDEL
ncbi:hypothetical protein WA158_003629 [Blastocystis sp. Blastoise]